MKLPTINELNVAETEYMEEGPNPMAAIIDQLPQFKTALLFIASNCRDPYSAMKVAMCLGLNLGIRIGESRKKAGTANERLH